MKIREKTKVSAIIYYVFDSYDPFADIAVLSPDNKVIPKYSKEITLQPNERFVVVSCEDGFELGAYLEKIQQQKKRVHEFWTVEWRDLVLRCGGSAPWVELTCIAKLVSK